MMERKSKNNNPRLVSHTIQDRGVKEPLSSFFVSLFYTPFGSNYILQKVVCFENEYKGEGRVKDTTET